MKTFLLLGLVALGVGLASFGITAVFVGATAAPASAGSAAVHAEPTPPAAPAATVAAPPTPARVASAPPVAAAWRPEIEGLPRPLSPIEAPAYLERTAIIQLGIREGLLDPNLTLLYRNESATLSAELRLRPDPRQREFAQVLAHSLISSVQALDLPIGVVHLTIADHLGQPGLTTHVGLTAARSRPPESWEPSAAGTRAFLAWAASVPSSATPEERVNLTGAWAR
ncbi:MAG: hypothetical protein KatS3mg060_0422 [Dehalococcoidia bacterium]|jgi:hypothetical protein|nr:MAG: hypothetical protein KatS3mg060_0422 [Dehalococcoidia bacterium]